MSSHAFLSLLSTNSSFCKPSTILSSTQSTTFGRNASQVDVYFDSARNPRMISRVHAKIDYVNGEWVIIDNNSINGLFVNDIKKSRHSLNDGDIIAFGGGGGLSEGAFKPQNQSEFLFQFRLGTPEQLNVTNPPPSPRKRPRPSFDEDTEQLKIKLHKKEEELLKKEQELELQNQIMKQQQEKEELEKTNKQKSFYEEIEKLHILLQEKDVKDHEQEKSIKQLQQQLELREKNAVNQQDFMEELTCSICQELIVSTMTLSCSHSFCESCISTWLSQKMICPVCRVVPRTPAIRGLHMDSLIEKLVSKLQGEDKQNYIYRRTEKEQVDKLKKGIAYARESGFKFLSIHDKWLDTERKVFSDGVSKYTGEARNLYCSLAGLTDYFISNASRDLLWVACQNLCGNFNKGSPIPALQKYLRNFLNHTHQ